MQIPNHPQVCKEIFCPKKCDQTNTQPLTHPHILITNLFPLTETSKVPYRVARITSDSDNLLGARIGPDQRLQHDDLRHALRLLLDLRVLALQINAPGILSAATQLVLRRGSGLKRLSTRN